MLKKMYRGLDLLRTAAIVGLLAGIVVLCLVQVVLRYFTSATLKPFAWGDEVIRLTSIWVVFLAASVGVKNGSHLSVEFFIQKYLPPKFIWLVKKLALVVVLCFLGAICWYGSIHVQTTMKSMLQNLPIPMALFYAAIPTGAAFLMLEYFILLIWGTNPFIEANEQEAEHD